MKYSESVGDISVTYEADTAEDVVKLINAIDGIPTEASKVGDAS